MVTEEERAVEGLAVPTARDSPEAFVAAAGATSQAERSSRTNQGKVGGP